jgi:uncharacterized Rmd1/YagE family protein
MSSLLCSAFCTASTYDLKNFIEDLRTKYKCTSFRDVVHVEIPTLESTKGTSSILCTALYFDYGVMVCWGLEKEKAREYLKLVKNFEHQPLEEAETDEFTYVYGESSKIVEDEIILPHQDILTKLAVSHGIAQSVKLGTFENALHKSYEESKHIPEALARKGRIPLSRKEIRRKMGDLFIERNSINLHVNVLDTPEFFWEYPELDSLYKMIANYLDISTRVEVLNQRLDVVHELFEMLGNELNHQHSSRLEWTIIWLIIIEVVLSLLRDVFRVI